MVHFERGSFRHQKKPRGQKPRWELKLLHDFIGVDEGKAGLTYDGERRLKQLREKRVLPKIKALERRKRHEFLKMLFEKPLSFKAGKLRVRVLRHAWKNIYQGGTGTGARPFVVCFINGKKLFFYKSSGKNSKMPGVWFPTAGPYVMEVFEGKKRVGFQAGHLEKMQGHPNTDLPNPVQDFPKWVVKVQEMLKRAESQGRLKLHEDWNAGTFVQVSKLLGEIPFTDLIKKHSDY